MKRLLIILSFFFARSLIGQSTLDSTLNFVTTHCYAGSSPDTQTITSSCTAPANIVSIYSRDAAKLTAARADSINSPYKDSIALERPTFNRYLGALLAVYNATSLPIADTMFQLAIHPNLLHKSANDITILADSTLGWLQNVKNNVLPCGNPAVDYLLSRYYLKETSYLGGGMLVLSTDTGCNTKNLVNAFNAISGITAQQDGYTETYITLDGTEIEDSVTGSFIDLTYIEQWGDCPSGCTCKSRWKFRVYNDCGVAYLGHTGCQAAGLLSTGISVISMGAQDLVVSPNPFKDKIRFVSSNELSANVRLSVSNVLGETEYFSDNTNLNNELNLQTLKAGVYYMKIERERRRTVFKIIKE